MYAAVPVILALGLRAISSEILIILDLAMPRMNGLEAACKLRAMSVKAPIVLFTMYADVLPREELSEAGISAVVSKTDLPALQHRIEELLVDH